jgi:hypothetical protein
MGSTSWSDATVAWNSSILPAIIVASMWMIAAWAQGIEPGATERSSSWASGATTLTKCEP